MQRRLHIRVRLQLPARLRWSAPLGQKIEQCRTINVSRGGLLLRSYQPLRPGYPLWVTFPFDPGNAEAQPEIVASVVRCAKSDDSSTSFLIALQFAGAAVRAAHENGSRRSELGSASSQNGNGRGSSVAVAIQVRPIKIPWHEEAMTVEVFADKLKFQTNREYQFGETLMISFAAPADLPWPTESESEAEVVGIEAEAGNDRLRVTVRRKTK